MSTSVMDMPTTSTFWKSEHSEDLLTLTHLAAVIPPPVKSLLKEIEKFFETFINGGRRNTFPKKLIFSPKETSGLGLQNLTDFFNSMGMTWFRRMGSSKSFWLTMLNEKN